MRHRLKLPQLPPPPPPPPPPPTRRVRYATMHSTIAFIGGGNMGGALLGGLRASGWPADAIQVIEPDATQRAALAQKHGIVAAAEPGAALASAATVVWAVKPQAFRAAAAPCAPYVGDALQLSVMAGIRASTIAAATGSQRVVRAMPNTPALIGLGMTGLCAGDSVTADERAEVERLLAATGQTLWVADEAALDALTAVSGSGPAYVFYLLEAMEDAAVALGLDRADGRRLAIATAVGAAGLARASADPPSVLRQRVTSPGGTTQAAIAALDEAGVAAAFGTAMQAAAQRASEMGNAFG